MALVARHFLAHVQLSLFSRCQMAFFQSTTDGTILVENSFLFMIVLRTIRQRQSLTCAYTDTIFSRFVAENEEEIHGENQSRISFFNEMPSYGFDGGYPDAIQSFLLAYRERQSKRVVFASMDFLYRSRRTCLMHSYASVERHSADIGLIWSVITSRWMTREKASQLVACAPMV